MDTITANVYCHMKALSDQNGFPPTIRQTAEQLHLSADEVEHALNELKQAGKIAVTDIPAKSIIEFIE